MVTGMQMFETPLHLAALEGRDAAVAMLLDNGSVVSVVDKHLRSPLHNAVIGNHINVISKLLECGADPTQKDEVRCAVTVLCDAVPMASVAGWPLPN